MLYSRAHSFPRSSRTRPSLSLLVSAVQYTVDRTLVACVESQSFCTQHRPQVMSLLRFNQSFCTQHRPQVCCKSIACILLRLCASQHFAFSLSFLSLSYLLVLSHLSVCLISHSSLAFCSHRLYHLVEHTDIILVVSLSLSCLEALMLHRPFSLLCS